MSYQTASNLGETPKSERIHIAFFGLRNAGKSTLVNALTGQDVAIVSDHPGTTTDPVSKAMEILPLGPCLLTDTAGLDDTEGEIGALRVKKSLAVLATTDVAIWVATVGDEAAPERQLFTQACQARHIPTLEYARGDSVEALKEAIAKLNLSDKPKPLIADLITAGDLIVCVCPIDASAPKGRLILPQQQVIREILESGATALVCQPTELPPTLASLKHPPRFVITDSQAFGAVSRLLPKDIPLTSFSIVFARAKGDLVVFCQGADALKNLKDGDRVLISEGCTHHRQCEDIGTVKIPKWVQALTQAHLTFDFTSGGGFPEDLSPYALVIHCGGCMLTRRQMQERIRLCQAAGVPIVNYGIAIAACHGIHASPETCMVVC